MFTDKYPNLFQSVEDWLNNHPDVTMAELTQMRNATASVTEKYFAEADRWPRELPEFTQIVRYADIAGGVNGVEILPETFGNRLIVTYLRARDDYPFDPLTEPPHWPGKDNVGYRWRFFVPTQWPLLVALVMYDRDQRKTCTE